MDIESTYVIMARNYRPQDERLKAVIAREKRQTPAVFFAARANLKNPPKILHRDRPQLIILFV